MTKYAKEILDIINNSDEHLTAEDIFLKLKEKNSNGVLATIYNNLARLCSEGLIRKVSFDGNKDRYDKITRHDHLVCKRCGKISDICSMDLTETIQNQIHIPVISYDLKINYICEDCYKKEGAKEE